MATTAIVHAADVTPGDFDSGIAFENTGRTMTEADVVGFAGLTGDYNPQHVNRDWTSRNMFGERIAHGLLLSSVGVGMIPQRLKRALGPMRTAHAVYKKPVVFGDTIRISGRALVGRDQADGGGPPLELRIINQRDETVCRMRLGFGPRDESPAIPEWAEPPMDAVDMTMAELLEGHPYRTPGRTITEAHLVGFSAITGDWNEPYANAEYAASHGPGARVAQEMLIIATAAPMVPLDVSRLIAARKADITWHRPTLVGDTMSIEGRFVESTPAGDGMVQEFYEFWTLNQRGEPLASLNLSLVMQDPASLG
ncbi:MAG TPA: MaoC/PaaZ C-terminal domain-containing protein [Thermoleophilaceae bacterium]|nr:MaoC/PaaZ C-terminal domain-containing protein [Thermoleophilaceae bacterium]